MFVASMSLDLLLGDVTSLKQKRGVVRPIVAEMGRRYAVSAAEVGHQDLYRRAEIGVALATGDPGHGSTVLDAVERWCAARPEVELLSARRWLRSDED
ncbi:MAG: DUF503 domain-containing protein [Nocardioidaceae bacterium]|nr:DUF503 domain-containing protein [Nocardioidaceae bacterium]MDQ3166468.1 DUF503 domain-containing protein [Actinomycetota bacterium]